MTPPVDRWTDGPIEHTAERWTLAEVLAEVLHLERRPRTIRITETYTRTIEVES